MRCVHCDGEHPLDEIEPSFRLPDEVVSVAEDEREFRVVAGKDLCFLRSLADTHYQYFLRSLMPFPVAGGTDSCRWGIWVEVSQFDFAATRKLWDQPGQHRYPPFPGRLANQIWGYPDTTRLAGSVQLVSRVEIPTFTLLDCDHFLVTEQRQGVPAETILRWLEPIYHPETLVHSMMPPS
jgi:hypothetical protein